MSCEAKLLHKKSSALQTMPAASANVSNIANVDNVDNVDIVTLLTSSDCGVVAI